MNTGDLITAREYMRMAISFERGTGDSLNLAISLNNFSDCLEALGDIDGAAAAATESLGAASIDGEWQNVRNAHAAIGWLAAMIGNAAKADEHFTAADRLQVAHGRTAIICTRCRQPLGRLAGPQRAYGRCAGADEPRAGDRPAEWLECRRRPCRTAAGPARPGRRGQRHSRAGTWPRRRRASGMATTSPSSPSRWPTRPVTRGPPGTSTRPTGMPPRRSVSPRHGRWCPPSRAPSPRAPGSTPARPRGPDARDHLARGRDAADAALRLATRHHLAWHELGALDAHAALDEAEGIDRGWAGKARALHARLVPPGLNPDPLGTVERLVAEQKAAAGGDESDDGSDG